MRDVEVKKTVVMIMFITLLSKVIGFGREVLISYYYGASNISDAYFISLTIPVVILSFVGVSITTGYIPFYSKILRDDGEGEGLRFSNILMSVSILISFVLILLVSVFTEPVVKLFASGFEGETLHLAIGFTRVTVWSMVFSGMLFILSGYLQIKEQFLWPALLGFIYNLAIILSVLLSKQISIDFLAYGLVASSFLQVVLLFFLSWKEGFVFRFTPDVKYKHLRSFGKSALPLIFGLSITQINVLVDKTIASSISVGGISALNYADRLNAFILSTVVMSISVVVYPRMAKAASEKDRVQMKNILSESMVFIALLLIPSSIGAMIFSKEITHMLFARGAFDTVALQLTSTSLMFYALGMMGMGLREILSRVFYSMQDTKTPMKNAALGMVLNIVLNFLLSRVLGVGGLALATSISATFTSLLLLVNLRRSIGPFGFKEIGYTMIKIFAVSMFMGGMVLCIFRILQPLTTEFIALIFAVLSGVVTYGFLITRMNIKSVDTLSALLSRRWKL